MSGAASAQVAHRLDSRALETAANRLNSRSHSRMGGAFDQGPRARARPTRGIGNVHFPITTRSREAQRYFDQGINLLYSFAYYEAERAFRQAAALDPDCAMAYWGLVEADEGRAETFLKLASAKKDRVTDRERRYIEAAERKRAGGQAAYIKALEELVLAYPDDLEAKVKLAWALPRNPANASNRMGIDALLRAVLATNPNHPGAHHFRIHLWDGPEARAALDSARAYPRCAPAIGHALHMPGHIYAQLGMWEEAAYAMDAAARAERRYFYENGQMTYDSWNYAHDVHYLIANLGYTGRIAEGVRLAQELLDVPRDPDSNNPQYDWQAAGQGRFAMMRMRVRGERWDDILNDKNPGWSDSTTNRGWLAYTLGMAYLGKENLTEARKQYQALVDLKASGEEMDCARLELGGRLKVREGDLNGGLADLQKAAEIEKEKFAYSDPSRFPRPLYESLAWGYLTARRWADAEATLRDGLKREPNNGFALCLLFEALAGAGKTAELTAAAAQLRSAWRCADPDLPALARALSAAPSTKQVCAPGQNFARPYRPSRDLKRIGPAAWQPFPAPNVMLTDTDGKPIRLVDFRGKNLLLVFYLGGDCKECLKQLDALSQEKAAIEALETQILAVCPDSPETLRAFRQQRPNFPFALGSDPQGAAARKFQAVDEFEDLPLHALILIDRQGRVWWRRSSSDPFTDFAFLKSEIARMNAWQDRN